jgi:peptidoglycan/xylan/chitin deacetylase (PgdA/CDA1 family)
MNHNFDRRRIPAVIHIHVDSLWTISEDFGHPTDRSDCSIYIRAIPEFLAMLGRCQIAATFFCIGDDARRTEQAHIMRMIVQQGHEIANHTMNHRQDFGRLTLAKKRREIVESNAVLQDTIKQQIVGFSSPGYFFDDDILLTLLELGYLYDSSRLPTPLLPFMAAARYLLSRGTPTGKRFGQLRDGWANQRPYFVKKKQKNARITSTLVEIPISVIPVIRFPFHSTMAFTFGLWLFKLGINQIRVHRLPLVYLFHAVDLLPRANGDINNKHPSLKLGFSKRLQIVEYMLRTIQQSFEIMTTSSFVEYFKENHLRRL